MKLHEERVVVEKRELDQKIGKLEAFLCGSTFESLDIKDKSLLAYQLRVMQNYSAILGERIGRF